MKCAKCNATVTVADSRCPKCKSDLLAFGSTVFYEKSKHKSDMSSPATGMVFGSVANEVKSSLSGFSADERKIFSPALRMIKRVFSQHLSEEEIEKVFDDEVLPAFDELSRDKDNAELLHKVESVIRSYLGDSVYEHYRTKGADVLRILRAGELANELMDNKEGEIDLSIRMFPYFKAAEKSCWMHIAKRYAELNNNSLIEKIDNWIGKNKDNIFIEDVPQWLIDRKKTLMEVIDGILTENEYFLGGSLRTGISIFVLGRLWEMKILRKDISRTETFKINNLLGAGGTDYEKEVLAEKLKDLQILRNERMHKDVEKSEFSVKKCGTLSYTCLRQIPEILEI